MDVKYIFVLCSGINQESEQFQIEIRRLCIHLANEDEMIADNSTIYATFVDDLATVYSIASCTEAGNNTRSQAILALYSEPVCSHNVIIPMTHLNCEHMRAVREENEEEQTELWYHAQSLVESQSILVTYISAMVDYVRGVVEIIPAAISVQKDGKVTMYNLSALRSMLKTQKRRQQQRLFARQSRP